MKPPKFFKKLTYAVAGFILSFAANAHEFWIEADSFNLDNPGEIKLSLRVGVDFAGDSVPNIPDWYRDFSYTHAAGTQPVIGNLGDVPAGSISLSRPGLYLVGYENHPEFVEISAKKFNTYLKAEGLEHVIAARKKAGTFDQSAREYYQRCAKSLLRLGDLKSNRETLQHSKGYRLELTPMNSPYDAPSIDVQVNFDGQSLENTLVVAFTKENPEQKQKLRTNNKGQVRFNITQQGTWMIKSVHMVPFTGEDADWISFWGNLTFSNKRSQ